MFKASGLLWSLAVIGTASAGLFLGSDNSAHSDIAKFQAQLAQYPHVPGSVVVKVKPSALHSLSAAEIFGAGQFRVMEIKPFETDATFYAVKLAGEEQMARYLEAAAHNPALQYAEPNYLYHSYGQRDEAPAEKIPNVSEFSRLWGMKNTGQKDSENTTGVAGADIGATKAWAITTGSKDITVAVIDTGVDYNHPELKDNIYTNPKEIAGNGIDDDGNGFVDDVHGWNFAGVSTNDPMDDNEHGTHVSGTIGANGEGGGKIAGVNWHVSIMPVKFLSGAGGGTLEDAVKAIQYATKMKVNIMSNSWGGGPFTQSMFDVIKEARDQGILFVAAAGNDGDNADSHPHYPAAYQLENVISVAASTNTDTLADFSTFGKRTVHIAAPGKNIYSSIPTAKGSYDTFSGTSMATPHVSGAAALVWSANPTMTYAQVKERLLKSRDFVPAFARTISSSGRLNVYNALQGIYPPSPEPTEDMWKDVAMAAPIESAHPYANNAKQDYTVEGPANAKFIRVVFSKVELEENYDFVKVYDAAGTQMDAVTGTGENVATFYTPGNKLTLKFTSDTSETKWGFAVAKVQVVY